MKKTLVLLLFFLAVAGWSEKLSAQTRVIKTPDGKTVTIPAKPSASRRPTPGKPTPGKPPSKPGTPAKPGAKPGKKPEAAPTTTPRPAKPETPPNPKELKLRPDENGKIRFNFKGQPWPALMEWLADVSELSLDWQELPPDYLNLVTQRSYSIEDGRDLINRHLLSRGFTMLRNGEVLTVVKIDKIDPSMVPRVHPDDLLKRDSHEFVKVSFRLDWLLADQIVEELKPMLSPNGKLTQLKSTNRMEAMDAVMNLREIHRLLTEEQSEGGQEQLVKKFRLEYTRASDVLEQLQGLLGIDKAAKKTTGKMTPQQQMMAQQRAMMAAQQRGKKPAPAAKPIAEVRLVLNDRENSILVNAPPDKMAIVVQAIKVIDLPKERGTSLLRNMNRMQVYRLAAIDPESLVSVLEDVGDLDFDTKLEVDEKNQAVIAYASLADHLTIRSLIDKLDGSGRQFHVISLRRLEADYVAGTIRFMMGEEEPKKQQTQSRFFSFNPYGSQKKKEETGDKFRVDADVEFNRLLVKANEIELKEVTNLLVKLGEIPPEGGNSSTMRVLDVDPGEDTERLLERLREMWPQLGPNELKIDPAPEKKQESSEPKTDGKENRNNTTKTKKADAERIKTEILPVAAHLALDQQYEVAQVDSTDSTSEKSAPHIGNKTERPIQPDSSFPSRRVPERIGTPPPISISRSPDGRLVISSQDTRALDRIEDLMRQMAPPPKDYRIFDVKYADAYYVTANLEEYFDDKEKESNPRNDFYSYYYGSSNQKTETPSRLSKRKPLKFIYDYDTNTILVQGGTPGQWKTIENLIKLYDRPRGTDAKLLRQSKLFTLEYAKAKFVADAIKEIYRDLLSANDKALASSQQQKQKSESRYTYVYGSGSEDTGQKIPKFKGALSVSVDETSNTVVVSSQPFLLKEVGDLIDSLEDAARPNVGTMRVIELRNANALDLQKSLSGMLGNKSGSSKSSKPKQAQNGNQKPTQPTVINK